ncbi:MAG TPA: hypothetical protein ENG63_10030 [Candidatus Desulfofervidus auxilii]|uniref:Mutator family transposase n=1 Tax=Desulfofervidus auxilii TaxID=1621989 RepID=A0A7C0U3X3_DESA2|nr:hypothetical protein [Candidatus Desulfofervidus auxilii]
MEKTGKDLKKIYQSSTEKEALKEFERFKKRWIVKYPESIQRVIYTTNLIKRAIKEIRKNIKVIRVLPFVESVKKIVYLQIRY